MKLIGAGIVMVSSLSVGFCLSRVRRKYLDSLRNLSEAFSLLAGELSLNRTPLPELMRWAVCHTEGCAAVFFQCVEKSFPSLGMKTFYELWCEAVGDCLHMLSKAEQRELYTAGKLLGRAELSRQVSALENCHALFRERLEQEEAAYVNDRKLSLWMPAAAGALLVLLLI